MRGKPGRIDQADLRNEINRNRLSFLETELQVCFTFVTLAQTRIRTGQPESAARAMADAEKGYSTLVRFLSGAKHSGSLGDQDLRYLQEGTERLRRGLDEVRRNMAGQAGSAKAKIA